MPIKFPCESCGQILSVGSRKAGRHAKCPKCFEPLLVPDAAQAEAMMARRRQRREQADDLAPHDPYAQFLVYDDEDEMELVYESDDDQAIDARPLDRTLVAVPRYVLYVQGALLGAVGLVCFALGIVIGGGFASSERDAVAVPRPCTISGSVSFTSTTGRVLPDEAAGVFALPKNREPPDRAPLVGLRPQDGAPPDNHPGLLILRQIGGGYARTDAEGRYRLRLPDVGEYYILVVSHSADRRAGEAVDRDDLAELGNYFSPPAYELLGDKQYRLEQQPVRGDTSLNFVFP